MKLQRRALIRSLFTAAAVMAVPRWLLASRPDAAFDADNSASVVSDLFEGPMTESDQVTLKVPDIAENGAVVPVTVSSSMANVSAISIIAKSNASPLTSTYMLSSACEPFVSTRIKMAKTADVIAVIKADGKLYSATKEVKVTIGGCGG